MLLLIFLFFLLVFFVIGYICEKIVKICEIFFSIGYYLMMFNWDIFVVYFKKGKFYKYDVINILNVDFVFKEDIILGDGWEVRKFLVVVN